MDTNTGYTLVEAKAALDAIEALVLQNTGKSITVEDFAVQLTAQMIIIHDFLEHEIVLSWNYYGVLTCALEEHGEGKQKYDTFTNVQSFALCFLNLCS